MAAERAHQREYRSRGRHLEGNSHAAPARYASAAEPVVPHQKSPAEGVEPRSQGLFNSTVGIMLALFVLVAVCGLTYLSGYERMAKETYRKTALGKIMSQTKARNQDLLQQMAIAESDSTVGNDAIKLGMIPVNEQTAVLAGEDSKQRIQVFASSSVR